MGTLQVLQPHNTYFQMHKFSKFWPHFQRCWDRWTQVWEFLSTTNWNKQSFYVLLFIMMEISSPLKAVKGLMHTLELCFWPHFLAQYFMSFHMVWSLMLCLKSIMPSFRNLFFWLLICMVLELTLGTKCIILFEKSKFFTRKWWVHFYFKSLLPMARSWKVINLTVR